jgi:hypothetical protein
MSKFFRSRSKADAIKSEGERLPSSHHNDTAPESSAETLSAKSSGLQLNTMNSKEVGKEMGGEESKIEEAEVDEEIIYPSKGEVGIITLALIFAVFMVALVSPRSCNLFELYINVLFSGSRTRRLLRPQSLASLTSSIPWVTSAGMKLSSLRVFFSAHSNSNPQVRFGLPPHIELFPAILWPPLCAVSCEVDFCPGSRAICAGFSSTILTRLYHGPQIPKSNESIGLLELLQHQQL